MTSTRRWLRQDEMAKRPQPRLFGLVMVTLAKAGTAQTSGAAKRSKVKFFMDFSQLKIGVSEDAHSACKITLAGATWRHQHERGRQDFSLLSIYSIRNLGTMVRMYDRFWRTVKS